MEREFPAAYYGKVPDSGTHEQYAVLGQSRDFPNEARHRFDELAGAFQWRGGGGNDPYEPCFAVWPVGEHGAIVARLSDSGPDRLNRPHTLRIEAVWLAREEELDWPAPIGGLLQRRAWPDSLAVEFASPLRLSLEHPNPGLEKPVTEALVEDKWVPAILVASHPNYNANGFEIIQDPTTPGGIHRTNRNVPIPKLAAMQTPSKQHRHRSSSHPVSLTQLLLAGCVLLVACVGLLAFVTYQYRENREVDKNLIKNLNDELQETKKSHAVERESWKEKERKLNEELRTAQRERDDLKNEREALVTEGKSLTDEQERQKEKISRTREILEKFEEKVNELKEIVQDLDDTAVLRNLQQPQ